MAGHYEQSVRNMVEEAGICDDCPKALSALRRAMRADAKNPEPTPVEKGSIDLVEAMVTYGLVGAATMLKNSACASQPDRAVCEPEERFKEMSVQIMDASTPDEATAIAQANGINVRFQ